MKNFKTTNKSFINVYERLHNHGIKNCDFMLELNDHLLAGVDVHDPNLSNEMKLRILEEVKNNIWFWFRECLTVNLEDGTSIPFKLNILSATMIYLYTKSRSQYVLSSKYTGKAETVNYLKEYISEYNNTIKIIHIADAEYTPSLYTQVKDFDFNISLILTTTVNDNDDNDHSKVRDMCTEWKLEYFDLNDSKLDDFYFIYYNYRELVEDPKKFYHECELSFNYNNDVLRREILCLRI